MALKAEGGGGRNAIKERSVDCGWVCGCMCVVFVVFVVKNTNIWTLLTGRNF